MKSLLIFYLAYEFLELIYVTQSCHFNFYLHGFLVHLPALLPLSLLPSTPSSEFQEHIQELGSACVLGADPRPDASKPRHHRCSLLHIPMHRPRASRPSEVFSCCRPLYVLQLLPAYGAAPAWGILRVQLIMPLTSLAALVTIRSPSLKITITGQIVLRRPHLPPFSLLPNHSKRSL